jgi:hypothetical protein
MSHEHIVVSGLYYYSNSPNIQDQGLAATGLNEDSGVGQEWGASVNLGKVSCSLLPFFFFLLSPPSFFLVLSAPFLLGEYPSFSFSTSSLFFLPYFID